jgi:hypothetical protein
MTTSSVPPELPRVNSERGRRPISPWVWAMINQLAFPGLGTIMMGRKVGYAQAVIMVIGFLMSVGFIGWMIVCGVRYLSHPEWSDAQYRAQYQPYAPWLRWGLALCAVAWLWALWSSAAMVKAKAMEKN